MRNKKILWFGFLIFTYIPVWGQTDTSIIEYVDHLTDSMITEAKVPGLMVSITCGSNTVYEKAKGFSNLEKKEPMDLKMRFRIGSLTKTFTITVLLQLVDEGLVKLEDTIDKYFPQVPNGKNITVRMLCDMSSGLHNYSETKEFDDSLRLVPRKKWKPEELVELAIRNETYFEPGKGFHYSNTNTVLAGMLIEKLTGKSLKDQITDRIILNYRMTSTEFPTEPEITGFHSDGYNEEEDKFVEPPVDVTDKYDPSWAWAAGAMISTIQDLKLYLVPLADGKLTSEKTHQERLKWSVEKGPMKYGCGIFKVGDDYLGHNGSIPGYQNISVHSPAKNCTIIVFYNAQTNRNPAELLMKIIERMK